MGSVFSKCQLFHILTKCCWALAKNCKKFTFEWAKVDLRHFYSQTFCQIRPSQQYLVVPFRKNKSIIGLILIWKITDGYWHNLVKWSWPTQPEFGPEFSPWGPTRPNSTQFWTQRAKSDLKTSRVRFNSGILGNYRVEFEFEPFLRSTQRNWTRFRSCGPTRPVWTQKLGPKSGWTKKNTDRVWLHYFWYWLPIL